MIDEEGKIAELDSDGQLCGTVPCGDMGKSQIELPLKWISRASLVPSFWIFTPQAFSIPETTSSLVPRSGVMTPKMAQETSQGHLMGTSTASGDALRCNRGDRVILLSVSRPNCNFGAQFRRRWRGRSGAKTMTGSGSIFKMASARALKQAGRPQASATRSRRSTFFLRSHSRQSGARDSGGDTDWQALGTWTCAVGGTNDVHV